MLISDVLHHAERGVVVLESTDDTPFLFLTRDEDLYPDLLDQDISDEWDTAGCEHEFVDFLTGEVSSVDLASFCGRIHLDILIGKLTREIDVNDGTKDGYTILCPTNGASFSLASDTEQLRSAMSQGIDPSSQQFATVPSRLVVNGGHHHIILDVDSLLEAMEK